MANPFDQFDANEGNPFDQFDAPAPKKAKPKRSFGENFAGAMANVNRGLVVGDEIQGGLRAVENVVRGKSKIDTSSAPNIFSSIGGAFNQGMSEQRAQEDQFTAEHPVIANQARGVGMAATAAVPTGPTANIFANSGRIANMARGAGVAALQAGTYAQLDRGTAAERAKAVVSAATNPITLGLGAAAGAISTPRVKKPPKPRRINPDVEMLSREGVQLTPGQMRGGLAKGAEDASTSLPIMGEAVAARRTEGVQTFNRAVVNRALKPVGETLPADIPAGVDAVKYAGDLLSKGYETAIPGKIVRADPGFADDVRAALQNVDTLTPESQANLQRILEQRLTSRIPQNGNVDGALYKQIQSELDFEVSRFSKATDPDQRAMGDAIESIQTAMENAARRQDPAFAAKIDALDRGWAELGRIETAAAKSADLSGVFTPAQYAQSIRSADGRVRRRGVARGEALSQDLAGAGVRVLPSKMPDSGTAGRAAWGMVASAPGAVLGAITGGGVGALAGIGGTAAGLGAMSTRYSPKAIEAANKALSARISAPARDAALAELAKIAARDPTAQALYRQVAARLSRAGGVAGAAASANIFAQPAQGASSQ